MNDNNIIEVTSEQQRLIDAKVSLLQLAKELGNIQKACRAAGIARSSFYEIKKAYEQFGKEGLRPNRRGKRVEPIPPEIEEKVLEFTREYPSYSYKRLMDQLQLEGYGIGESQIKRVWKKHDLSKKLDRFLWLDKEATEGRAVVTEKALKAIRRLKRLDEASDQHIQVSEPGELVCQDLYFVGTIKGVGRVYMQSAIDCFCSVGFAKLSVSKQPIHSVALVHEQILPFYDELKLPVQTILTDNGREYCGRSDRHLFELYLGAQSVDHRTTKTASPWTNGFVERFHRTVKDEFFAKAFRSKWYKSVDELQADLDAFMEKYNNHRVHRGYRTNGRTPMQTLKDWIEKPKGGQEAA